MRCRFCGKRLALLRKLTDGEFCSSPHRKQFLEEEQKLAMARLAEGGGRAGHSAGLPDARETPGGDAQGKRPAGFRTEQFNANPGSLSPAVQPAVLEGALSVCLVERVGREAPAMSPFATAGCAVLPYEPVLAIAGSPSGIRGGAALPIPPGRQACAAVPSISTAARIPRGSGLVGLAAPEPQGATQLPIRRPRTSVYLKLARPTPPALTSRVAAGTIGASPLVADALTLAGPGRGVMTAIEPAEIRLARTGIGLLKDARLCTTGIDLESVPVTELVATGRLAPEAGLAPLALIVAGVPNHRPAPLYEAFGAAPARPSWRAGQAEQGLRPAPVSVDPWPGEAQPPDFPKRRHPKPEAGGFEARTAFPAPSVLPAAAPDCATALAIQAPAPTPPGVGAPAAVPDFLALCVATEIPAETVRLATADTLCPLVAAGLPDPAATPRRVSPAAGAEPLLPPAPAVGWNPMPPDVTVGARLAGPVALAWPPTTLKQAGRRPAEPPAPLEPELKPLLVRLRLAPVSWSPGREAGLPAIAGPWMAASRFWAEAPADLKWLSLVLPAVLVAALLSAAGWLPSRTAGAAPRVESASRSGQVGALVGQGWASLKRNVGSRAAISLQDDFRSGLGEWQGPDNWSKGWEYDSASFILTGPLALFRPSLELTDYRFEFLGQIDKKSLNWVFRAADYKNYYAMKIVLAKYGPLHKATIVHYAVIDGTPERVVQTPLPLEVRGDSFFRVRMQVRGENFTTSVQDQVVDSWSDDRLARGGVGFFSEKGERARLRWMEVSHQYDTLGRLCALLAPYRIQSADGSVNRP